jgi:hypothetical protein
MVVADDGIAYIRYTAGLVRVYGVNELRCMARGLREDTPRVVSSAPIQMSAPVSNTKLLSAAARELQARDNVVNFAEARIARATVLPAWTCLPPYVIYDTGPRYAPGSGTLLYLPVRTPAPRSER